MKEMFELVHPHYFEEDITLRLRELSFITGRDDHNFCSGQRGEHRFVRVTEGESFFSKSMKRVSEFLVDWVFCPGRTHFSSLGKRGGTKIVLVWSSYPGKNDSSPNT